MHSPGVFYHVCGRYTDIFFFAHMFLKDGREATPHAVILSDVYNKPLQDKQKKLDKSSVTFVSFNGKLQAHTKSRERSI